MRNKYKDKLKQKNNINSNNQSDIILKSIRLVQKYFKMNIYMENSFENALEIILRKKYNKIILISNIGLDLSGKRFIEVTRKILNLISKNKQIIRN